MFLLHSNPTHRRAPSFLLGLDRRPRLLPLQPDKEIEMRTKDMAILAVMSMLLSGGDIKIKFDDMRIIQFPTDD